MNDGHEEKTMKAEERTKRVQDNGAQKPRKEIQNSQRERSLDVKKRRVEGKSRLAGIGMAENLVKVLYVGSDSWEW